ncbi:nickel/cobalt transporter [Maridesulfovibrio salexigens]|uniref:High-affinity nickel-transporter n=1 Tax=Maridesulfovibrio salexigens (strain ATCC 14822 / DSM 2638 / NCIMB 8403 / VKM B-1763) TaxID=526222 RepID=C6BZB0_MARSD|nr:sulfite exporter TauE/SafE family protein [Maridesulfovibrio salexigens]ACS80747.1 high-affinity nickel-transporter [Maridesulfovibrio salexigens DSM 2638]
MRKLFIIFIVLIYCLSGVVAQAHPLGEVVQETTVMNEGTRLLIVYDTSIGPSITATLIPDADHDGKVSGAEERKLSRDINYLLLPNLEIYLDEKPVVPELYYDSVSAAPGGYNNGLRSNLVYAIPLPDEDFGKHYLKFSDNNFQTGELKWLKWKVQADPQFSVVRTSPDSRELNYQFFAKKVEGQGASFPVPAPTADGSGLKPSPQEDSSQAALKDYLAQENLGPGTILFALGLAFFLGMGHALSPGHGKAMVAAYLIGRSGRIRDAFTLGTIVTITHVASVIVLGIAALLLSRYFLPGDLYPWLGAFSGALVFGVGYMMLARRAVHSHGHSHDHHHGHSHDHSHEHGNESEPVSWWSMLSLGIAGGMVPCPTALVVLLASVAFGRIVFGLMLILAFSLGLAAVLIIIGILTVRASKLTERFSGSRRWIENLPVLSAGLVMLAGIAIALNALNAGGILRFNF